jgi:hypothetical protein
MFMHLHVFFAATENMLIEIRIRFITTVIKIYSLSLTEHIFACFVCIGIFGI